MKPTRIVITRVKKLAEPVFGIFPDALEKFTQNRLDAMRDQHPEAFQELQRASKKALTGKNGQ